MNVYGWFGDMGDDGHPAGTLLTGGEMDMVSFSGKEAALRARITAMSASMEVSHVVKTLYFLVRRGWRGVGRAGVRIHGLGAVGDNCQ